MIRILHIDTSNQFCSVALSENDKLKDLKESGEKNAHSRVITIFIDEILKSNQLDSKQIDAVAVSMGPGSYTGLRIGVSAAKGLCYALDKPLIAVSTLKAMALNSIHHLKNHKPADENTLYCPMIDARRMEVYSALYDENGKIQREIKAEIIDENSFEKELSQHKIVFSGDGSEKCEAILAHHQNAIFQKEIQPSARFVIPIAWDKFNKNQFEDTAYFTPFYLKEFVAGLPRVKGLK